MISKKQARIIKDQVITTDAIDEREFKSDDVAAKVFAQEWAVLNDQLTVSQSYEIQDEMDQVATVAERLMVVRNWRHRLDSAAKPATIYEMAKAVVEERAACFPDETVTVWENGRIRVVMYRYQDLLKMAVNLSSARITVGQLTPDKWIWTLGRPDYGRWADKVRKMMKG